MGQRVLDAGVPGHAGSKQDLKKESNCDTWRVGKRREGEDNSSYQLKNARAEFHQLITKKNPHKHQNLRECGKKWEFGEVLRHHKAFW